MTDLLQWIAILALAIALFVHVIWPDNPYE